MSFAVKGIFLLLTIPAWIFGKIGLKSKQTVVVSRVALLLFVMAFLYNLKVTVLSPRYLMINAALFSILLVDLYSQRPRLLVLFLAFTCIINVYELSTGMYYKSNIRKDLNLVSYDNKTLILVPNGTSYHTSAFYLDPPVYVFDPYR